MLLNHCVATFASQRDCDGLVYGKRVFGCCADVKLVLAGANNMALVIGCHHQIKRQSPLPTAALVRLRSHEDKLIPSVVSMSGG